jgi:hypothetical protein
MMRRNIQMFLRILPNLRNHQDHQYPLNIPIHQEWQDSLDLQFHQELRFIGEEDRKLN